jgi:PAS domain S-box-containing protein
MASNDFSLLEAIAVPVVVLDRRGHVVFWNSAHAAAAGYSSDQASGCHVRAFLAAESGALLIDAMASLSADSPATGLELDWKTRAGDITRLAFSARLGSFPASDEALIVMTGAPMPERGDLLAISAPAPAGVVAREPEAAYEGIVSQAVDAIVAVDAGQRIVLFNRGAEKIFGWSAEEAIGQAIDILIPRRSRKRHAAAVAEFARGPVSARRMAEGRSTITGLRKNGDAFPAEADIYKLDIAGATLLVSSLRDISARKRQENQQTFLAHASAVLASSLEYEETLSMVARLAVPLLADYCVVDLREERGIRRLKVVHVDPNMAPLATALEAVQVREPQAHPVWQQLEDRRSVLLREIPAGFLEQAAQSPEHLRLLQELAPVSLISVPLVAGARVLGALSFCSVHAERIYTEEDVRLAEELARRAALAIDNSQLYTFAQRAIRARDEILGVVAHDLRNPLHTVEIASEIMLRNPAGEQAEIHSLAQLILRAAGRADRLIQDLLDVARIEGGGLAVERALCEPGKLLDDALEMMRPGAEKASVELTGAAQPGLPEVEADHDRVLQVFSNLIGNAIKFTPAGGRIDLAVARSEDDVCFSIADTGPGIAADHLPHLFDRFWQARPTDRRGAGLGLAIAKAIIEAHGGRIWAESTPGSGSTFFFTIPMLPSSAPRLEGNP